MERDHNFYKSRLRRNRTRNLLGSHTEDGMIRYEDPPHIVRSDATVAHSTGAVNDEEDNQRDASFGDVNAFTSHFETQRPKKRHKPHAHPTIAEGSLSHVRKEQPQGEVDGDAFRASCNDLSEVSINLRAL